MNQNTYTSNLSAIIGKTGTLTSEQIFHTIIMRKKEACNMHESLITAFRMLGHHALKEWNKYREKCERYELYCAQDTTHETFGTSCIPNPAMEEDLKQTLDSILKNFTFNGIESAEATGSLSTNYITMFKWLVPYILEWEEETVSFYSGCIYHLTHNKEFSLIPMVEKYLCGTIAEKEEFRRTYERMCRRGYSMDVIFDDTYNKKWEHELKEMNKHS